MQWLPYIEEMRKRFGDMEFANPMSNIVTLKQSRSVENYYEEFLTLLNSLQLSPAYALRIFIINLHPNLSKTVRLFFPKTLSNAFSLAKQLESLNNIAHRRTFTPYKTPPQALSHNFNFTQNTSKSTTLPPFLPTLNIPMLSVPPNATKTFANSTQKLTTWSKPVQTKGNKLPTKQEMDEKRKNGLCMWCEVKFTGGHRCIKS